MDAEPAGHHVTGRLALLRYVVQSSRKCAGAWTFLAYLGPKPASSQYIPLIGPSSGPCGHSDQATRPLHGCSLLHFKRPFLALVGTSGPSPSLPHPPKIAGVPAPLQIQLALVPQIPLPSTQGPQRDVQAGQCLLNTRPDFSQNYCQFSVRPGKLG